jgi:SAM-dependent methyltransferase
MTEKIYTELADWWQLFSPVEDYADEAAFFARIIRENCLSPCRAVLELGAGAGGNAFHLKKHFELTLVDLSPQMLAESRKINPECRHLTGDMRDVRIGQDFDAVFIHDAIMYMTSEEDLRRALETAFAHCKPGAVAVVAPDFVEETFQTSTEQGGRDDAQTKRALRWLEWCFDPHPNDATFESHYAFLLKEAGGEMRAEYEKHTEGLFARESWRRLFREVGFSEPKVITDLYAREIFAAVRPIN